MIATKTNTTGNTILNSIINANDETILPVVRWVCAGSFRDLMTLSSLSHGWNSRVTRYFLLDKSLTERCITTYVDKLHETVKQYEARRYHEYGYNTSWGTEILEKVELPLRNIVKGKEINDYHVREILEIIHAASFIHAVFGIGRYKGLLDKGSDIDELKKFSPPRLTRDGGASLISDCMELSHSSSHLPFVVMVSLFKNHENPEVCKEIIKSLKSIFKDSTANSPEGLTVKVIRKDWGNALEVFNKSIFSNELFWPYLGDCIVDCIVSSLLFGAYLGDIFGLDLSRKLDEAFR